MNNTLYLVVPCYNEEEVLPDSSKILLEIVNVLMLKNKISKDSKILFINDGSKDSTWEIIKRLHEENDIFSGICLSRNKGQQNALIAGLTEASKRADMMITIDVDLQDDPSCIEMMVDKYLEGYDVVHGVRSDRKKDSFIKRFTAQCYYKFMKFMGVNLVYNSSECRLFSKKACESLLNYQENDVFIRGLVQLVGYKTTTVSYKRNPRTKGKTKYSLKSLIKLAILSIENFSLKPLKLIGFFGWLNFIGGLTSSIVIACLPNNFDHYSYLIYILICVAIALSGVILLAINLIGKYLGRTYMETKRRPKYFIMENLLEEKKD